MKTKIGNIKELKDIFVEIEKNRVIDYEVPGYSVSHFEFKFKCKLCKDFIEFTSNFDEEKLFIPLKKHLELHLKLKELKIL